MIQWVAHLQFLSNAPVSGSTVLYISLDTCTCIHIQQPVLLICVMYIDPYIHTCIHACMYVRTYTYVATYMHVIHPYKI